MHMTKLYKPAFLVAATILATPGMSGSGSGTGPPPLQMDIMEVARGQANELKNAGLYLDNSGEMALVMMNRTIPAATGSQDKEILSVSADDFQTLQTNSGADITVMTPGEAPLLYRIESGDKPGALSLSQR